MRESGENSEPRAAEGERRKGTQSWQSTAWRVATALLCVHAAGVFVGLCLLLPIRFDLSFPEGALVARMMDVAAGRTPYTDWRLWPHGFAPYGPLTYYPPGWLAGVIFDQPELMDFYRLGRLHSLGFLLGIWILLTGLGRRIGLPWPVALAPMGLFSIWRWLQEFAFSFRPDGPQVFFALFALWVAAGGRANRSRIILAFSALMASFWYKPTSWGVALALGLWISWSLGRTRAALALAGFGVTGLALALAMNMGLDGALISNMLGVTDVGWEPLRLIAKWRDYPPIPSAFLVLAIPVAVSWVRTERREEGAAGRLLALAFLFSTAFAVVQFAKNGADRNYFLEAYAIACVLFTWGLKRWLSGEIRPRLRQAAAVGLIGGLILITGEGLRGLRDELDRSRRLSNELPGVDALRGEGQLVLAYHPYLALVLGTEPSVLDAFQFMRLIEDNPEIESSLLRRVEDEKFDLIVIPRSATYLYAENFLPLLERHYVEDGLLGPNIVYRPRGSGGDHAADD